MNAPRAPRDRLALLLAQWFGSGLAPRAPGTVGSVAALPLYFALRPLPTPLYVGVSLLVCLVGLWAAGRAAALLGDDDPSSVVIDEVAGVLLALGFVRGHPLWELVAWLSFRLLDIAKPGPIDRAQYLPPVGLGIMADDVLAGIVAGLLAAGLSSLALF